MAGSKLFGGKSLLDFAKEGEGKSKETPTSAAPSGTEPKAHFAASQMVLRGSPVPIAERRAVLSVDAKRCKLWPFHDRDQIWYTPESCSDVIESIRQEGQKDPALARKLEGDPNFDYEIVIGGRRRYACETLGIPLKIEIAQITDREAAVRMHIENHDRQGLSPMESAMSYARHLKEKVFPNQEELAKSIRRSPAQVSKMVRAAGIMEVSAIRKLFPDVREIPVEEAAKVASLLEQDSTRGIVIKAAEQMGRSGSHKEKRASARLKLLISAPQRSSLSTALKKDFNVGKQGRAFVTRNTKGKVTLAFPNGITAENREEVLVTVNEIVDVLTGGGPAVS